ncbi:MAG: hypothetical protein QOD36_555 [Mycobacterium sp.]|jgi:hypothetical protein|nr:hypothetical protein [Mycobacterium sp.]
MSAEPLRANDAVARELCYPISKTQHVCEMCVLPRKSTSLSCEPTQSAIEGNVTEILRATPPTLRPPSHPPKAARP